VAVVVVVVVIVGFDVVVVLDVVVVVDVNRLIWLMWLLVVGWLVGWLAGWLAGWLVGWLSLLLLFDVYCLLLAFFSLLYAVAWLLVLGCWFL